MATREIHLAGPWTGTEQRCVRCGRILADITANGRTMSGKGTPYPDGALVETTRTYQSMTLTDRRPTCKVAPTAPVGATTTKGVTTDV